MDILAPDLPDRPEYQGDLSNQVQEKHHFFFTVAVGAGAGGAGLGVACFFT